jgi:drug/metabolite transporter (DMT)-like permease
MTQTHRETVWLAIALSLLSLMLFDLMGLVIKFLTPRYGAAELSAYRNLIGLIPSLIALWSSRAWHAAGRRWRIRQWPIGCLRGVCVTFAQFFLYVSLGHMAFATATTITYSNALFMTAFAVPILGEKVGPVRWAAVVLGFAGVLWIMKPGSESFTIYAAAPLASAMLYALSGVIARRIDSDVPSPLVNLYSSGTALLGAILLALVTGGFGPIQSLGDLGWIVMMGTFGGLGVLVMVISYRMADQSTLAPFSYFGIPFAFSFGWLFFGEAPFADLFPGALLIAGGGLLVIWRERMMRRRRIAAER